MQSQHPREQDQGQESQRNVSKVFQCQHPLHQIPAHKHQRNQNQFLAVVQDATQLAINKLFGTDVRHQQQFQRPRISFTRQCRHPLRVDQHHRQQAQGNKCRSNR